MALVSPSATFLLVIDTCADRASLALFQGEALLAEVFLEERAASAVLLQGIRGLLAAHDVSLGQLAAIGVMNGPGSFTGMRVGLAAAKGLCEATGLRLAAVSRLAALGEAAEISAGYAVLGAGREQVYVRHRQGAETAREWLEDLASVRPQLRGQPVAVTSAEMANLLKDSAGEVRLVELSARHAAPAAWRCVAEGGSDLLTTDANYVRNEDAIYARTAKAAAAR